MLSGVLRVIAYTIVICMSYTMVRANYKYYKWRTGREKQALAWNVITWAILLMVFMLKLGRFIVRG